MQASIDFSVINVKSQSRQSVQLVDVNFGSTKHAPQILGSNDTKSLALAFVISQLHGAP